MNTNRSPSLRCSLQCNSPIPTGNCNFCESCRLTIWLSIFVSIKSIFWSVFIFKKVCIHVRRAQLHKLKRDRNKILNSLFICTFCMLRGGTWDFKWRGWSKYGAKSQDPKKSLGLPTKPKKIPGPKINPQKIPCLTHAMWSNTIVNY